MSRFLTAAALTLALSGAAYAQQTAATTSVTPGTTPIVKNCGPGTTADTSSDMGNLGTGASSSKMGTGSQNAGATGDDTNGQGNSGVMGTMAPATSGNGATGAVPGSCK